MLMKLNDKILFDQYNCINSIKKAEILLKAKDWPSKGLMMGQFSIMIWIWDIMQSLKRF